MGPGGLATPNRAGVCGRPPTNRPLLAVREDGGVYSPSLRSRAVRLPPTPCRVCFRPCVFNKFSHFCQKRWGGPKVVSGEARDRGEWCGEWAHAVRTSGPLWATTRWRQSFRISTLPSATVSSRLGTASLEEAIEMLRSHLLWRSAHELAMANTEDPPPLIGSTLCAIRLKLPNPPIPCHHPLRLHLLRGAGQNLRGREARPRTAAAACASGAASST